MPTLARRSFLTLCAALGLAATACGSDGGGEAEVDGASDDRAIRLRRTYGDHGAAFGELWLPPGDDTIGCVVLIHGGFWRDQYGLDLMDGLAASAAEAGHAAWNIEYRRLGGGGGYPETFLDVAAAVDHVAVLVDDPDVSGRLDLDRVTVVGHSAGGQLAAWVAGRHALPAGAVGAQPVVRPAVAFAQAGVLDLVGCALDRFGGSACSDLLGGMPDDVPDRYATTSPLAMVPVDVSVVAVHGSADDIVPLDQSRRYVDAATAAGDPAELVVVDGADHFALIDPDHAAWRAVLDRIS